MVRNLSRNGILFASPERLEIGESIEIRLAEGHAGQPGATLRLRGSVVRLEELPPQLEAPGDDAAVPDRFEIGVAFDLDWGATSDDLLEFLEQVQARRLGHRG